MDYPNAQKSFREIAKEVKDYSKKGNIPSLKMELVKMRDMIVDVLDYSSYFDVFYPIFGDILNKIPIQFKKNDLHFCRKTVLEIIQRIPLQPKLSVYAVELMELCMKILQADNEENAVIVIKLIMDIHKKFKKSVPRLKKYVHEFLDFVKIMYGNFLKIMNMLMDPNHPEDTVVIPKAQLSSKVLTECPLLVVFVFQSYQNPSDNNNLHELLDIMIESFNHPEVEYDPRNDRLRDNYCSLVSCKVKTASFLAYTLRVYNQFIAKHRDSIPEIVTNLLLSCPRESIQARKELLVIMRHMIDSRNAQLRNYFVPYIEAFLDDANLTMKNCASHESMRPLAYSTLADLVHHVRNQLSLGMIAKTVTFYTKVMFDSTLKIAIQTMSAKLLVHLVESIFVSRDKKMGLSILLHIMESFIKKIKSLSFYIKNVLLSAPQRREKEKEKDYWRAFFQPMKLEEDDIEFRFEEDRVDYDPIDLEEEKKKKQERLLKENQDFAVDMARQKINLENEERVRNQCKTLVKTLILGLKNVVYVIHSLEKEQLSQPTGYNLDDLHSVALDCCIPGKGLGRVGLHSGLGLQGNFDGGRFRVIGRLVPFEKKILMKRLFKYGIRCFLIYDFNRRSMTNEAKDNLDSFSSLFTVLSESSFAAILKTLIPDLYDLTIKNRVFLKITRHFLASIKLSKTFLNALLSFLETKLGEMSGTKNEGRLILSMYHLVFRGVVSFPANEPVLRGFVEKMVTTCVLFSSKAKESRNYIHLLNLLFRTLCNSKFNTLFDTVMPFVGDVYIKCEELLDGEKKSEFRDLIVELVLTIPFKLHVVCPHLQRVLLPIIYGLEGKNVNMVGKALAALDIWVTGLKMTCVEPILRPRLTQLHQSLFLHLKPKPYPYGAAALKLLAKMGGLSRRYGLDPPKMPTYEHPHSCRTKFLFVNEKLEKSIIEREYFAIKRQYWLNIDDDDDVKENANDKMKDEIDENKMIDEEIEGEGENEKEDIVVDQEFSEAGFDFVLDPYVEVARKIMLSSSSKKEQKIEAVKFIQNLICTMIDTKGEKYVIPKIVKTSCNLHMSDEHFAHPSLVDNEYKPKTVLGKTIPIVESEERLFRFLAESVFQMVSIRGLEELTMPFVTKICEHFALLIVSKSLQRTSRGKDFSVLIILDSLIDVVCSNYRAALVVMKKFLDTVLAICHGNKSLLTSFEIWSRFLGKLCHCCYMSEWRKKLGGCVGLKCLCQYLSPEFLSKHEPDLFWSLLHTVKYEEDYVETKVFEESRETIFSIIEVCQGPFLKAERKSESPFGEIKNGLPTTPDGMRLYNLFKVLISELSSGSVRVRSIVKELFSHFAKISGRSVSDFLEMFKKTLGTSLSVKRFDGFPQATKRGYLDALQYFLNIKPRFLPLNTNILEILERAIKLVDVLRNPKRVKFSDAELETREKLEFSSLNLLCTTLVCEDMLEDNIQEDKVEEIREKIVQKLFELMQGTYTPHHDQVVKFCKDGLMEFLKKCGEKTRQDTYKKIRKILGDQTNIETLTLEGITKIGNMLELSSADFVNKLFSTLLTHLEKWVNSGSISQSREERLLFVSEIASLFEMIPYSKDQDSEIGKIIRAFESMENTFSDFCSDFQSPFRSALSKVCSKYPRGTIDTMFEKQSQFGGVSFIENRRLFFMFQSILKSEHFSKGCRILADENESYVDTLLPYLNPEISSKDQVKTNVELELRTICFLSLLQDLHPKMFRRCDQLYDCFLHIWKKHMYPVRTLSSNPVDIHRTKAMLKAFMSYYRFIKEDDGDAESSILFEILLVLSDRTAMDLTFVVAFVREEVIDLTCSQRKDVIRSTMRLYEDRKDSCKRLSDMLTEIFEYIIIPSIHLGKKHGNLEEWVDEELLEEFIPFLLKYEEDNYYDSNAFHVQIVLVFTLLVNIVPDLMEAYHKELLEYVLYFTGLKRVTFKHCILLLGAVVVQKYEKKIKVNTVLQVYEKMLSCEYPEGKAVIQQGLEMILPFVRETFKLKSSELPGFPKWIGITNRACIEDGYCGPTMSHIWLFVNRHSSAFFPYRPIFVYKMVNSLARMTISQNLSYENRKLGLRIAELCINWHFENFEDNDFDFDKNPDDDFDVLDESVLGKRKFVLKPPKKYHLDRFDERGNLLTDNKMKNLYLVQERDDSEKRKGMMKNFQEERKEKKISKLRQQAIGVEIKEEEKYREPTRKKRKLSGTRHLDIVEEEETLDGSRASDIDRTIFMYIMDFTLSVSKIVNQNPPISKLSSGQIIELSDIGVKVLHKTLRVCPKDKEICKEIVIRICKMNHREEINTEGIRILRFVILYQREFVVDCLDYINAYTLNLLTMENERIIRHYSALIRELTRIFPISSRENPEKVKKFYIDIFEKIRVVLRTWEKSLIPQTRTLGNRRFDSSRNPGYKAVYGYLKIITTLCYSSPRHSEEFTKLVIVILSKVIKLQISRSTQELQLKEAQAQAQIQDQIKTRSQLSMVRKKLLRDITTHKIDNVPVIILCLRFLSDVSHYYTFETFYSYLMFHGQILERSDFFNTEVVLETMKQIKAWMTTKHDYKWFLFKPKQYAFFLNRMTKFEVLEQPKELRMFFYGILGDLFKDKRIMTRKGYLPSRIESLFMSGCGSNDDEIVQYVMKTANKVAGPSLRDRLTFIFQSEHWSHLKNTFWIMFANDLLFDVIDLDYPLRLPKFPKLVSIFSQENDIMEVLPQDSYAAPSAGNLMTTPRNVSIVDEYSTIVYRVPQECRKISRKIKDILDNHKKFLLKCKKLTAKDIVQPLRTICFNQDVVSKQVWVELFVGAWSSLSEEERQYFHKPLLVLLARDYHSSQYVRYPNVIQALLEGATSISPKIPISPEQLRFLGKSFNCWNVVLPWVEEKLHVILNENETDNYEVKERFTTSITELYRTLGEEDMSVGVWRRFGVQDSTKILFSLENNDRWEYVQSFLQNTFKEYHDGMLKRHVVKNPEISVWEDSWMNATKKLQQWGELVKFAREVKMRGLILECDWNQGKWQQEDGFMKHPSVARSQLLHIYTMGYGIMQNSFSDAIEYFLSASQAALQRWCALPNFHCRTHFTMINSFQQLVELYESARLVGENFLMLTSRLQSFFSKWTGRLANKNDSVEAWGDITLWRYHFLKKIGSCNLANNPKFQCLREAMNQIVSFISILRKKGLYDASRILLKKSEGIGKMVQDKKQVIFIQTVQEVKNLLSEGKNDYALRVLERHEAFKNLQQNKREIQVLRLKGMAYTNTRNFEIAKRCFSRAVECFPDKYITIHEANVKLGNVFAGWGRLYEVMYRDTDDFTCLRDAVACYFQSLRFKPIWNRCIPNLLLLLGMDNEKKEIYNISELCLEDIPHWVFIPWIETLFSMCQGDVEHHAAVKILQEVINNYPQAAYFEMRSFFCESSSVLDKLRGIIEKEKREGVGKQQQQQQQQPRMRKKTKEEIEFMKTQISVLEVINKRLDPVMAKYLQNHSPFVHELEGILKEFQNRFKPEVEDEISRSLLVLLKMIYECQLTRETDVPETIIKLCEDICSIYFRDRNLFIERYRKKIIESKKAKNKGEEDNENENDEKIVLPKIFRKSKCISTLESKMVAEFKKNTQILFSDKKHANALRLLKRNKEIDFVSRIKIIRKIPKKRKHIYLRNFIKIIEKWLTFIKGFLDALPKKIDLESCSKHLAAVRMNEYRLPFQFTNDSFCRKPIPFAHERCLFFDPEIEVIERNKIHSKRISIRGSSGESHKYIIAYSPHLQHNPFFDNSEERSFLLLRHLNILLLKYNIPFHKKHLKFKYPKVVSLGRNVRMIYEKTRFESIDSIFKQALVETFDTQKSKKFEGNFDEDNISSFNFMRKVWIDLNFNKFNFSRKFVMKHVSKLIPKDFFKKYILQFCTNWNEFFQIRKEYSAQVGMMGVMKYLMSVDRHDVHSFLLGLNTGEIHHYDFRPKVNRKGEFVFPKFPERNTEEKLVKSANEAAAVKIESVKKNGKESKKKGEETEGEGENDYEEELKKKQEETRKRREKHFFVSMRLTRNFKHFLMPFCVEGRLFSVLNLLTNSLFDIRKDLENTLRLYCRHELLSWQAYHYKHVEYKHRNEGQIKETTDYNVQSVLGKLLQLCEPDEVSRELNCKHSGKFVIFDPDNAKKKFLEDTRKKTKIATSKRKIKKEEVNTTNANVKDEKNRGKGTATRKQPTPSPTIKIPVKQSPNDLDIYDVIFTNGETEKYENNFDRWGVKSPIKSDVLMHSLDEESVYNMPLSWLPFF